MHRITDLHLCEGIQICVPSWKSTILYTLTEDYKFVHLCRVIQMITNLYTFTEDYKFVHLHRGLQICTPLQRITNLCALMFTHTFIDRCTLDHCHRVPLQPLLRNLRLALWFTDKFAYSAQRMSQSVGMPIEIDTQHQDSLPMLTQWLCKLSLLYGCTVWWPHYQ